MKTTQSVQSEEVFADPRTRSAAALAADFSAQGPARTSETPIPLSGMASKATRERRADQLQRELAVLETRFATLGERLSGALREFQSETLPDGNLGTELTALQGDFGAFRALVVEVAGTLSVPAEPVTGPSLRLEGLRQVLKQIDEAEQRRAFVELRDRAASELRVALGLAYRSNPGFAPLEECKGQVRRLLAEIAASEWPNSHPECSPLAERRHTVSRLLDLVRRGAELSDDECEVAVDAVAESFGKLLAIAAARGRLSLADDASVLSDTEARCPGCRADLDPGARFCGECGMKID